MASNNNYTPPPQYGNGMPAWKGNTKMADKEHCSICGGKIAPSAEEGEIPICVECSESRERRTGKMDDRKPTEICDTCRYYNPDKCYGYCQFHHKPKNENETCDKWYDWNDNPPDPIRAAAEAMAREIYKVSHDEFLDRDWREDFEQRIRREVERERERCHGIVISESEHINGAGLCEVFNRMLRRIRKGGSHE